MNYIIDKSIIKLLIAKIKSVFLGLSYNAIISPIEVFKKNLELSYFDIIFFSRSNESYNWQKNVDNDFLQSHFSSLKLYWCKLHFLNIQK